MNHHHKQRGFSLVEMAIVMVIIGLIVAAVTVGKSTMQSANTMKAFKQVVEPCVAAVHEGIRNGTNPILPSIAAIDLENGTVSCTFTRSTVTVTNSTEPLRHLMAKQINNGVDVLVKDSTVTVYAPGVDDDDGDGVEDSTDAFALNNAEDTDTDGDGIGNNADTDDDGDGTLDLMDDFPLDANEDTDTDGDGIGNNADTDDDNDGYADTEDDNPLVARFIDNQNGTVTDTQKNLVLLKNAQCYGQGNWQATMDQASFLADGACGLSDGSVAGDWRLPDLASNEQHLEDAANSGMITGLSPSSFYWTNYGSDQRFLEKAYSHRLIPPGGYWAHKGENLHMWPVRSP